MNKNQQVQLPFDDDAFFFKFVSETEYEDIMKADKLLINNLFQYGKKGLLSSSIYFFIPAFNAFASVKDRPSSQYQSSQTMVEIPDSFYFDEEGNRQPLIIEQEEEIEVPYSYSEKYKILRENIQKELEIEAEQFQQELQMQEQRILEFEEQIKTQIKPEKQLSNKEKRQLKKNQKRWDESGNFSKWDQEYDLQKENKLFEQLNASIKEQENLINSNENSSTITSQSLVYLQQIIISLLQIASFESARKRFKSLLSIRGGKTQTKGGVVNTAVKMAYDFIPLPGIIKAPVKNIIGNILDSVKKSNKENDSYDYGYNDTESTNKVVQFSKTIYRVFEKSPLTTFIIIAFAYYVLPKRNGKIDTSKVPLPFLKKKTFLEKLLNKSQDLAFFLLSNPIYPILLVLIFVYRVQVFAFLQSQAAKTNLTSRAFDLLTEQGKYIQQLTDKVFGRLNDTTTILKNEQEKTLLKEEKRTVAKDIKIDKLQDIVDDIKTQSSKKDIAYVKLEGQLDTCNNLNSYNYYQVNECESTLLQIKSQFNALHQITSKPLSDSEQQLNLVQDSLKQLGATISSLPNQQQILPNQKFVADKADKALLGHTQQIIIKFSEQKPVSDEKSYFFGLFKSKPHVPETPNYGLYGSHGPKTVQIFNESETMKEVMLGQTIMNQLGRHFL